MLGVLRVALNHNIVRLLIVISGEIRELPEVGVYICKLIVTPVAICNSGVIS